MATLSLQGKNGGVQCLFSYRVGQREAGLFVTDLSVQSRMSTATAAWPGRSVQLKVTG